MTSATKSKVGVSTFRLSPTWIASHQSCFLKEINEELKKMLIDRDDLYMQQDAILVDVEDFTK